MFWNKKTNENNLDSIMIELGRESERGIALWYALASNHWDEMEGNVYHQKIAIMMDELLKDKSLTDTERIDLSNKILEFSKRYRSTINRVSSVYEEFVTNNLNKFEEMLQGLPKEKSYTNEVEWLKLSRDLCKIRKDQITAVNIHIDTDDFIPLLTIKYGGIADLILKKEETDAFAQKLGTYGGLRESTYKDEKEIISTRSNLSEKIFGGINNYLKDGSYDDLVNELKSY